MGLGSQDSESFCFMGFESSKAAEMAVQKLDQSGPMTVACGHDGSFIFTVVFLLKK